MGNFKNTNTYMLWVEQCLIKYLLSLVARAPENSKAWWLGGGNTKKIKSAFIGFCPLL